jgi:outer membrane protein
MNSLCKALILFLSITLLEWPELALAETKIGFVNMQKAIQATSAGKKAQADLEAEFNKKKAELKKEENQLNTAELTLKKRKPFFHRKRFRFSKRSSKMISWLFKDS